MRLRSSMIRDVPVPRRGRASKVQQHALTLVAGAKRLEIPSELEAFADKTAPTLATSLERQLRRVAEAMFANSSGANGSGARPEQEVWFVHHVVGDGIATNLAAAKLLWACVAERPLGAGVVYFLLVVKCGTHQAGLSAKNGVAGRAAALAGGELYKTLEGTAVRLSKYLINQYFEEFCTAASLWVSAQLRVLAHGDGAREQRAKVVALRELYTAHVVPDKMLALWNNGLGLSHEVGPGEDPEQVKPRVVKGFSEFITQNLLHVDEHPTATRFFTFRGIVDRMLTMLLIGMPSHVFTLPGVNPREGNKKRLRLVHSFFSHAEAPQLLRRASLVLQLSGGVEALTARDSRACRTANGNGARAREPPVQVSLAKGDAQAVVVNRLRRILGAMHHDPGLELMPAINTLLATGADLIVRFEIYRQYPFRICYLCRVWFPASWYESCASFLREPEACLDIGLSLQIQQISVGQGGRARGNRVAELSSRPSFSCESRH